MIEPAPKKQRSQTEALAILRNPAYADLLRKIERNYLYWDKVKYLATGDLSALSLWHAVKLSRKLQMKTVTFGRYTFRFAITERILALLHKFDLNFGGTLSSEGAVSADDKKYILNSSTMEEAIASSQMEGANTTRKVAKDMLRKQATPRNKGERMIVNNYNTIRLISDISGEEFTVKQICRLHRMISNATLDDSANEGKLRDNDDIMVMNALTGEIVHTPPSHEEIADMLEQLCRFANEDNPDTFIHPIVRGIIIHFMLAYIHPFCDGNGRTARSLIYWYLLKNKYWFVEYLSISRIIYRNKTKYERAFLCVENDELDLTYFILYHLEVMEDAFIELKEYLNKKIRERSTISSLLGIPGVTRRQAQILNFLDENPDKMISAKEIANKFGLTPKSIRLDLRKLSKLSLITETQVNGREHGYSRHPDIEQKIEELKQGKNRE